MIRNFSKKKPRVLIIYDYLPPREGGIETHVNNLLNYLTKYAVVYYLGLKQEKQPSITLEGNRILVPSIHGLHLIIRIIIGLWLILKKRIGLIHAHTLSSPSLIAMACSLLTRKPLIVTVHESSFINNIKRKKLVTMLKYRLLLKFAKHIITVSRELKFYILDLCSEENKVTEIPNGVDLKLFHPRGLIYNSVDSYPITIRKIMQEKDEGKQVVLCPRRIVEKNGIVYLLDAIPEVVKKYDNVLFVFVGPIQDKRYWDSICKRVKELKIKQFTIFTGGVPNNLMPIYYDLADIVVIPSLVEATSIAALEAMACGKPIIATKVGGLLEIIKHYYNGLLVPPADSKALAQAILLLLLDRKLLNNLAYNALCFAKYYSWENIISRILSIYNSILKS